MIVSVCKERIWEAFLDKDFLEMWILRKEGVVKGIIERVREPWGGVKTGKLNLVERDINQGSQNRKTV